MLPIACMQFLMCNDVRYVYMRNYVKSGRATLLTVALHCKN